MLFERVTDVAFPPSKPAANEGLWGPVECLLRAFAGKRMHTISGEIVEHEAVTQP